MRNWLVWYFPMSILVYLQGIVWEEYSNSRRAYNKHEWQSPKA